MAYYKAMKTLSQTELYIMSAIWDLHEEQQQITTDDIAQKLPEERWGRQALISFLNKLGSKGYIRKATSGRHYRLNEYTVLISRDAFTSEQSRLLVAQLYKGSWKSYLASLAIDDKHAREVVAKMLEEQSEEK